MTESKKLELKGPVVVIALVVLTAVVGTLFIAVGPRATERHPGVLHVGVRYDNEGTAGFLQYNNGRPMTRFLLFAANDASPALTQDGLLVGRNLVPIENLEPGRYRARVEAEGYVAAEFQVQVEGRMVLPVDAAEYPDNSAVDRNLIGVRLRTLE